MRVDYGKLFSHETTFTCYLRSSLSNTRVPTQIKKSQNESTRVNTCPTRVNTNQQESKTSQHESAQVNTYQHKSRSVLDESI